jgi:hypothetical protein
MRPYRELKKQNSPKVNDLMKKWGNELNRTFSKEKVQMGKKNRKEMVTIPGHKGNANQNHIKILPYSCYHSHHQEYHQQQTLVRMLGKKLLHFAGGNVNY